MQRCNQNRRRIFVPSRELPKAFTLIELLVVIAIIAILAAILFPVFAQAREKARAASCLSNTKQMGIAVMQYTQDYDETYPNGTYLYSVIGGWAGQLYPYIKSAAVFRCPSDISPNNPGEHDSSYAMNSNFGKSGYNASGVNNVAYALADLNASSKTVLFFEVQGSQFLDVTTYYEGPYGVNYNSSPFGNGVTDGYSPSGGGTFYACPPPDTGSTLKYATGYMGSRDPGSFACHYTGVTGRHQNGSNFLMGDGHAKWLQGSAVSSGGNATNETATQQPWQYGAAAGSSGAVNGVQAAATFSIK